MHPAVDEDFSIQNKDGKFGCSQAEIIELDASKNELKRLDRVRKRNMAASTIFDF